VAARRAVLLEHVVHVLRARARAGVAVERVAQHAADEDAEARRHGPERGVDRDVAQRRVAALGERGYMTVTYSSRDQILM
jgi:hypothetical protein